jgi:predicted nucleotidyltransferase
MRGIMKLLKKSMKLMLNFYFKDFKSDDLPNIFAALKKTFDAANVPFYLIGARARDVWFLPEKNMRITRDVDWIAASEEGTVFKEIRHQLIEKEGFIETKNPYTLLSPKGMDVDLLPFIENTGRSLEGLREVFARGTEGVSFDDGSTYQVATLPAIVLLKFIAWDDRPEYRLKDLGDIGLILDNYFDRFDNDIYDNHNDLFGDRELEHIAAYVVGRKIKHIIGNSAHLKERLTHILTAQRAEITKRMANLNSKTEEYINRILQNLLDGILENTEGV